MAISTPGGAGILAIGLGRVAWWILAGCLLAEAAFLLLDYHVNHAGLDRPGPLRRLANIAREDGLASWFATVQTVLIAVTALAIQRVSAHRHGGPRAYGWLALAILFLYLAVDDGAQVHERVASAFDANVQADSGVALFPSYTWQVLFLPAFALCGLFMLVFLWIEFERTSARWLLVIAMGSLALAIVLDFIEGLEQDHPLNLLAYLDARLDLDAWTHERFDESAFDALRHFGRAIEETLEMFAMTLIWFVFLRHLADAARGLLIQILADD